MLKNLLRNLFSAKRLARFAFAALSFSLSIGAAHAVPGSQANPDQYNYTRGGGG